MRKKNTFFCQPVHFVTDLSAKTNTQPLPFHDKFRQGIHWRTTRLKLTDGQEAAVYSVSSSVSSSHAQKFCWHAAAAAAASRFLESSYTSSLARAREWASERTCVHALLLCENRRRPFVGKRRSKRTCQMARMNRYPSSRKTRNMEWVRKVFNIISWPNCCATVTARANLSGHEMISSLRASFLFMKTVRTHVFV